MVLKVIKTHEMFAIKHCFMQRLWIILPNILKTKQNHHHTHSTRMIVLKQSITTDRHVQFDIPVITDNVFNVINVFISGF